jgi:Bacterial regulatory proteins, lacI family
MGIKLPLQQDCNIVSGAFRGNVPKRPVSWHNARVARGRLDGAPRNPQRVTVRDIADLAGVSAATVSRVLNGRRDVSEETRSLVTRVMREHGYRGTRRTASRADGVGNGRNGLVVGLLVPLVQRVYFSAIYGGAA